VKARWVRRYLHHQRGRNRSDEHDLRILMISSPRYNDYCYNILIAHLISSTLFPNKLEHLPLLLRIDDGLLKAVDATVDHLSMPLHRTSTRKLLYLDASPCFRHSPCTRHPISGERFLDAYVSSS